MELATVNAALLTLSDESTVEAFADTLDMLDAVDARVKDLRRQWKSAAFARCEASGPMLIGTRKFYIGTPRKVKCKNVPAAVRAILEHSGGDEDAFLACLASDAVKQGEAAKVLPPDVWARLFEVTNDPKLENKEPTKKDLIELDTRYLR